MKEKSPSQQTNFLLPKKSITEICCWLNKTLKNFKEKLTMMLKKFERNIKNN